MELRQALRLKKITLPFFVALMSGCAFTQIDPITSELADKGVVVVESDKTYLAATKFISRESEADENFKSLLKDHGNPSALSVSSTMFSDTSARAYFASQGTYYDLTKSASGWLITGPFPLTESEVKQLSAVSIKSEPAAAQAAETPAEGTSAPSVAEPIAKVPVEVKSEHAEVPTKENGFASPSAKEGGSADAETTPKGDIVHYVTLPGETLSIISRWYTNERENAGKIGRLNKLKDANQLEIGDVIVIPSYLIKNKKRFTEDSLKAMQEHIAKEIK